jgi:hypothetical protein
MVVECWVIYMKLFGINSNDWTYDGEISSWTFSNGQHTITLMEVSNLPSIFALQDDIVVELVPKRQCCNRRTREG